MWLFMAPSVLVMALVLFYPVFSAVYYRFFNYYLGSQSITFAGFDNYTNPCFN